MSYKMLLEPLGGCVHAALLGVLSGECGSTCLRPKKPPGGARLLFRAGAEAGRFPAPHSAPTSKLTLRHFPMQCSFQKVPMWGEGANKPEDPTWKGQGGQCWSLSP